MLTVSEGLKHIIPSIICDKKIISSDQKLIIKYTPQYNNTTNTRTDVRSPSKTCRINKPCSLKWFISATLKQSPGIKVFITSS